MGNSEAARSDLLKTNWCVPWAVSADDAPRGVLTYHLTSLEQRPGSDASDEWVDVEASGSEYGDPVALRMTATYPFKCSSMVLTRLSRARSRHTSSEKNLEVPDIKLETSLSVARNSGHYFTEAVSVISLLSKRASIAMFVSGRVLRPASQQETETLALEHKKVEDPWSSPSFVPGSTYPSGVTFATWRVLDVSKPFQKRGISRASQICLPLEQNYPCWICVTPGNPYAPFEDEQPQGLYNPFLIGWSLFES
uniref:Uncharacterized protein n=1 Tax=Timema genevievae TaxID=629358 RepID=A0A7R9PP78_TIMGE|nr:unnamed protein product [Timema genevievae]